MRNAFDVASFFPMQSPIFLFLKLFFKGLFGIHLFYWSWKLFVESIVDKDKS